MPVPNNPGPARARDVPLELGIGFRLSRLVRVLRAQWSADLAQLALAPPQAAVLRAVAEHPGCSLRALARVLGAEPMTAKRCVDDLEGRGLLTSAHRGEDRRPRALQLTAAGNSVAVDVGALVRHQDARLSAALGAEGRTCLERVLVVLEAELASTDDARSTSAHANRSAGRASRSATSLRERQGSEPDGNTANPMTKEQGE